MTKTSKAVKTPSVKTVVKKSSAAKPAAHRNRTKPAGSKSAAAVKAHKTIADRLKKMSKSDQAKFHAKSTKASETAWVTIGKLRAIALAAAKAGRARPKQAVTSKESGREFFVTDKQWAWAKEQSAK